MLSLGKVVRCHVEVASFDQCLDVNLHMDQSDLLICLWVESTVFWIYLLFDYRLLYLV